MTNPMTKPAFDRWLPLAGVVTVVGLVARIALSGAPAIDASTAEVARYYANNESKTFALAFLSAWTSVFFIFFVAAWRSFIAEREGGAGLLAAVILIGGAIDAAGQFVHATFLFALADTAGSIAPSVTQTLHVLSEDGFLIIFGGFAAFLLGSGFAIMRTGALPTWLGWAAFPIGILLLTPMSFVGLVLGLLWIVTLSVMLFLRVGAEPATA